MSQILHAYGKEFNTSSANVIVPYLKDFFNPTSVVDFGCGIGTWLSVFQEHDDIDILGIDGQHLLNSNQLLISTENFLSSNLEEFKFEDVNRVFDLAICLEVAEHIEKEYAPNFIKQLCALSQVIIFSAAIPGQTGENHHNEQYPDYWEKLFMENDFIFLDPFRTLFWDNFDVEWWYRQNLYLVVHKSLESKYEFPRWKGQVYIIKELFDMYVNQLNSRNTNELPKICNIDAYPTKEIVRYLVKKIVKKIIF